jgi:predicted PurR-regulated permease PerM
MWGVMAMLLNFVPYLGAAVGIVVVLIAGLVTFDSLSQALMAPAIYAGFNIIESQIVTPVVLGRRLTLNSVIVFLSVGFWGWIWGVPGALMAVPLLVILKVLCDHISQLSALGEFLSGRRPPAQ